MTARPLLLYPDPGLRRAAEPVAVFDATLAALAADLLDTLRAVQAIGLTAPHIGVSQRLVLIRLQPDEPHTPYVNPEIVWASPERASVDEGSVSMPGVSEPVERAARVRARWRGLDGAPFEAEVEGFPAACLQHEIDQLDGVFWIERLTRLRRERALKRYAKVQAGARRRSAP